MRSVLVLVFFAMVSTSALACDKAGAKKSLGMLREMAVWSEKGGDVTFKWGSDWDHAAPHERLALVQAFANSDACLTGRAREINFYRLGKLVAQASPTSGIRLVE